MRKLTLLGVLLAAGGFCGGLGSFAALAWSGERIYEMELSPGSGGSRDHEIALDLRPDMNPLAMTATSSDAGATASIAVTDANGTVIFEQDQGGKPGGEAAWFFAPIQIIAAGRHRIVYSIDRDIEGSIDLRANVFVLTPAIMFSCLGLMFVGFGLLVLTSIQRAIATMKEVRRMQAGPNPVPGP